MRSRPQRRTNEIVEPRYLLKHWRKWAESTFSDDDIFLHVGLVRIERPYRYIATCFEALEERVFQRRPGSLIRFPVLSLMEGYLHMHALIKSVPYTNVKRGYVAFEDLVHDRFSRAFVRRGDVLTQRVSGGAGIPLIYALEKQGPVEVLVEAMHLPSRS